MYGLSVSKGPNQFNENGSYMTWQPNRPTSVRIQEMSRSASLAANTLYTSTVTQEHTSVSTSSRLRPPFSLVLNK
ncbi:hypothetical protein NC652_001313 [Populus alba x Populus x berolinensis]|uniref:Uncharacterized protein n=1 Tax=Populus alba x Populus x berolinensis TaxID=444605 RepID=A0AAD6WGD9_9ROSI|nr:hypothetical protein NC652_001313 [Populus alba x Populus x berolinensis]KAJ7010851.1 hypothetical protein NC653_001339 [Populus alba x Populus x berolinensis]